MAINYKTSGSWTAIPTAALYSTYAGSYHIEYPPAEDVTLNGIPCGAFGKPTIVIRSPWMTDEGMDFWRDLFTVGAHYVAMSLEVYDSRLGATTRYAGYLAQPRFESQGWGSTSGKTTYRNVEIRLTECTVTT
jgi:hypothetical protein